MVSEVIPVFSRKVIFGYEFVAASTVAIALVSFGVWAHHMFTVGMSQTVDVYFAAASLVVGIPTGVKMFNWLATIYGGRIRTRRTHALLLRLLVDVRDRRLDGHHARGGADRLSAQRQLLCRRPFPLGDHRRHLDGAFRRALLLVSQGHRPDVFGTARPVALLALLVGFILTFGPMHIAGILGMPRRIFTYQADRGWQLWNVLTGIGAFIQAPSYLIFAWNLLISLK